MTAEFLDRILERLRAADPGNRQEIARRLERATADMPWVPNPGPQFRTYHCQADELFYGGQDAARSRPRPHGASAFFDPAAHQQGCVEPVAEILGHRNGYNGQLQRWRQGNWLIEFAGCEHEDDNQRFKGGSP